MYKIILASVYKDKIIETVLELEKVRYIIDRIKPVKYSDEQKLYYTEVYVKQHSYKDGKVMWDIIRKNPYIAYDVGELHKKINRDDLCYKLYEAVYGGNKDADC